MSEFPLDRRNIIDEFKGLSVEEIKAKIPKHDFSVAAFNIDYNLNIGNMVRSCNAFAGKEFIIIGKKHWDRRGSVGVQNYTNIIYLPDADAFIQWLKNNKRYVIAVDNTVDSAVCIDDITRYPDNALFVFGNECDGLPKSIYDLAQMTIKIHQYGSVRSLNVAVAAGIVMYSWIFYKKNQPNCFAT